jgi:hypothetical protein
MLTKQNANLNQTVRELKETIANKEQEFGKKESSLTEQFKVEKDKLSAKIDEHVAAFSVKDREVTGLLHEKK